MTCHCCAKAATFVCRRLGFKTQACCNYSFTHPQILSCLRSQLRKELWTDYRGFADVPPDLFERGVRNPTVAVLEEILNGLSWPNDKARIAPAAARAVQLSEIEIG